MDLAGRILELEEQIQDLKACLTRLVCVGKVVATNPETATVRVELPGHDDLVTDFLPVLYQKTQDDKEYWMPDIGEQVVVLFVPLGGYETGFVLGASYNQADAVPMVSQNKWHKRFKDGTYLEYDRNEHVLKGRIKGRVELVVDKSLSASIGQDASVEVGGNLSAQVGKNATVEAGVSIDLTAPHISFFKDGAYFEYDRNEHVLKGRVKDQVELVELVVDKSLSASIGQDASIEVGGNLSAQVSKSASVQAEESIDLTAPHISFQDDITSSDGTYLEYDRNEHILKGRIKGRVELVVDESLSASVGQDASVEVGGNLSAQVSKSASVQAEESINLTAPQISLQGDISSSGSGGSVGQETKNANTNHTGNYVLNGNLTVNGSIFASGDILCDGANANHHSHG